MILRIKWFLCLSLSCVASLGAVPHAGAAEAQWIEVQSPHFSVVTDAGEKRGREVAMRFEQKRAVFSTSMTKVNVNIQPARSSSNTSSNTAHKAHTRLVPPHAQPASERGPYRG